MASNTHWTLDKKVPLAVIVTMLGGFGGLIWQAAAQDARISRLDERTENMEQIREDITVLKVEQRTVKETTSRIERKLDSIVGAHP